MPVAWKNDADFLLVSPGSDLSNPSQFRGRHRQQQQISAAATLPAAVPLCSVRRSRTSKVCPKQPPPPTQRTHLPPPSRFYFPTGTPNRNRTADEEDYDDDDDNDKNNTNEAYKEEPKNSMNKNLEEKQQQKQQRPNDNNPIAADQVPHPTRSLTNTWKAKCAKAKQQLGECWSSCATDDIQHQNNNHKMNDEASEPDRRLIRHYSQRQVAHDQIIADADAQSRSQKPNEIPSNNNHEPYLQLEQFQPVWKEQLTEAVPHQPITIPNCEQSIETSLASALPSKPPALFETDIKKGAGPAHLPSVTYSTDPEEEISIFAGRALSLNSSHLRPSRPSYNSTATATSTATSHRSLASTVLQHKTQSVPIQQQLLPHRTFSHDSTIATASTSGAATVLQPLSNNNNTVHNSSSVFRKNPTTGNTTTKQAEILSHKNDALRPRASIERTTNQRTSLSTSVATNKEERHRLLVQEEVQRQIDAAQQQRQQNSSLTTSRVDRLRQQYQQELEKLKVVHPKGSTAVVPVQQQQRASIGNRNDRFSVPAKIDPTPSFAETRRAFEKRSSSVPSRRSAEASYDNNKRKPETSAKNIVVVPTNSKAPTSSTLSSMTTTLRRSVSAPRGRPSIDGSALLHLSGRWQSQIVVPASEEHPQLPVLLQMAGWNNNHEKKKQFQTVSKAKDVSSTLLSKNLVAPSTVKTTNVSRAAALQKEARLSTQSEPGPTSAAISNLIASTMPPRRKTTSMDLPRREPSLRKGRTMALMLQQAYFQEEDDDEVIAASTYNKPNYLALAYQSPAHTRSTTALVVGPSPALSIVSTNTATSLPVVSDQALCNAEFLFESDADLTVLPTTSKAIQESECSLTTWNSSNRILQTASGQPAIIPPCSSHDQNSEIHSVSSRRVRFSDGLDDYVPSTQSYDSSLQNVHIPFIESKLSDLTEKTAGGRLPPSSLRQSSLSSQTTSSMSIPRIDSIPKEEDDGEPDHTQSLHLSILSNEDRVDMIFEDIDEADETTPMKPPQMRWSYRTEGGMLQGVTPLLSGKSGATVTTNSPYLRFKEAKEKFATNGTATETYPNIKKSPVKRASPAKISANSLVTSRVAAVEGRRVRSEDGATFKLVRSKNKRRATTGSEVIAPRKGSLASPYFKKVCVTHDHKCKSEISSNAKSPTQTQELPSEQKDDIHKEVPFQSPTFVDGEIVARSPASQLPCTHNLNDSSLASVVSTDSEDEFGAILHPTVIDEESDEDDGHPDNKQSANWANDSGDVESDDDAFYQLLNYEESEDDKSFHKHSVPGLSDAKSVVSLTSSNGETASLPSWLKGRSSIATYEDDYSVVSAVERMKNALPFREAAPVKPNEQQQRAPLGSQSFSTVNQMPMKARTWRELAAAAHEKDHPKSANINGLVGGRSSLSERSMNTIGR